MTLAIENLTKRYVSGRGVTDISLNVERGEVLALIGPSGCGKTTLLRAIAGLIPVDAGRIVLGGKDITPLPPERRNIGLIFQNYALFPHLSVFENVAYGLRARGQDRATIAASVARALAVVDLKGRDGRVDQLSGGEQQRVAVARAVVTEPAALMLDEPLSNLDPNLRHRMREGLRSILERLAIPSVHVTHDQEEALAIADRVAVLDAGRLAQIGTPDEVYRRPTNAFVARFVGAANVVRGRVAGMSDGVALVTVFGGAELAGRTGAPLPVGDQVDVALRPETIELSSDGANPGWDATVVAREFLGAVVGLRCEAAGETLVVRMPSHGPAARKQPGDRVRLSVDPSQVWVMRPSP